MAHLKKFTGNVIDRNGTEIHRFFGNLNTISIKDLKRQRRNKYHTRELDVAMLVPRLFLALAQLRNRRGNGGRNRDGENEALVTHTEENLFRSK